MITLDLTSVKFQFSLGSWRLADGFASQGLFKEKKTPKKKPNKPNKQTNI